ncbi:MAG: hypothetical protein B7Z73_16640 [Planctomycetia bacterium 21-64-5]|nr:MAG: hypothetical protein B7Z73_16640 [Planctomycetia bacterium 21-64-5]
MVEPYPSLGVGAVNHARPRGAADIWVAALAYWYLTALIVGAAFSFGFYLVRPGSPRGTQTRDWLGAFNWEDGGWYRQIATEGYNYRTAGRSNAAFFPAYPLLGRALIAATGFRAEAALLIVSNLSLLVAMAMLAFYARDRCRGGPDDLADYVLLATAFFPTGCFFRLAYSESTFLFVAILAMYAMLRRWPFWAITLVVGTATATRPVGLALLAPFAIHVWRRTLAAHESAAARSEPAGQPQRQVAAGGEAPNAGACPGGTQPRRWFRRRRFGLVGARLMLYLPLACWGLGLFIVHQHRSFGEPLAFAKAHTKWGTPVHWREKAIALATLRPIWSVYDPKSRAFWINRDHHAVPWLSLQFANPVFFASAVALIALGALCPLAKNLGEGATSGRWLSLEETSFGALLLLIPYVTRACEMEMG